MIDQIYSLVQNILNKNGKGILSPSRFILDSKNAQLKIYGNIFDEYERKKQKANVFAYRESLAVLEDVLDIFVFTDDAISRLSGGIVREYHTLPSDYKAFINASADGVDMTKINARAKASIKRNYYISPSAKNPYCYIEGNKLYVLPDDIGIIENSTGDVVIPQVELVYYRYPSDPNWTYNTVNGKAVFNVSDAAYQDFELPQSQFNKLVTEILALEGVHIRDEVVMQYANNEEQKEFQKDNS